MMVVPICRLLPSPFSRERMNDCRMSSSVVCRPPSHSSSDPRLLPAFASLPLSSASHRPQSSPRLLFSHHRCSHRTHSANIHPPSSSSSLAIRSLAIALLFGGTLAFLKTLASALPPDFSQRWHTFFEEHRSRACSKKTNKENVIYDVNGEVVATVRTLVGYAQPSEIPKLMWEAVVACEDRRFFQHHGVDPRGLARAILTLTRQGGGSTITQQLAKNVFLRNDRTVARKILEMLLALLIETQMSKQDILLAYINKIYWGHGTHGIEAAANFYFGKSPGHLTIGECVMLAGMIPAPEIFSPFRDPNRGKKAQKRALQRMVETGVLDTHSAEVIFNEQLEFNYGDTKTASKPCKAPFFVDEVLFELERRYGRDRISEGGLRIHTTLDLHMQDLAEMIIDALMDKYDDQRAGFRQKDIEEFLKERRGLLERAHHQSLEASMVVMEHSTGAVRVLVGGRDYSRNSYNRALRAHRMPGTIFDPVVYLTAVAEGMNRRDMLEDELIRPVGKRNPRLKHMTAPITRLCNKVGMDKVRKMGNLLGIKSLAPSDLSLGLQQFKVTPFEMATAYATIAAGGIYHEPHLITKVKTADGQTLGKHISIDDRVVDKLAIMELHKLLQAVMQKGNGKNGQLARCAAGVSGTSDGNKDAWFAGFTPHLCCLVWLGHDDNSCVNDIYLGGTGASFAAVIWKRFMDLVHKEFDVSDKDSKSSLKRFMMFKRKRKLRRHVAPMFKMKGEK